MYQALYRKWRPRVFDDVVGQEHVTDTLKNQVKSDRLSHAYLFVGTRGTGKTSCAKILAKAVNCENPQNGNPCNKCRSCIGIDDGSILDVLELDAASNNGVDNVRALRDEAVFSPTVTKKRVYIIDEVHMLSTSAFNALLKILEEPPEHLLFILATTELHKVPATILSRCQRHSFKRINPEALAKRISYVAEEENMKLEPNAADLLARLSDGALRDGLSLLDQCSGFEVINVENVLLAMGLAGNLRIAELLDSIIEGETAKSLELFRKLWNDGKAPVTLLTELTSLLRDILMLKVAPKGGRELLSGGFDMDTIGKYSARMLPEELICNLNTIQEHIGSLRDGRDPKTTAELCIIKLCEPNLGDSIDALKKRITKLENAVADGTIQPMQHSPKKNEEKPDYEKNVLTAVEAPARANEKSDEISGIYTHNRNEVELISQSDIHVDAEKLPPIIAEEERPIAPDVNNDVHESGNIKRNTENDLGDVWKSILEELKKKLLPGQYNIVSNERMAKSKVDDNCLTIEVSDEFVKGQLEQNSVTNCIREAVQAVMGRPLLIKVSVNKETKSVNTDKLNNLSKFGNVKFE